MSPMIITENKIGLPLTRDFRQLLNSCLSGGKFIVIHPHYALIREAMRLDIIGEEQLDDLEIAINEQQEEEFIHLEKEQVLFLYSLLEIICRLFVCEIGDDLKKLAIECGDTNEEEFLKVRSFFLHQAEAFLHGTNETFRDHEEFISLKHRISQLDELS
jgi:hypothetical protein